MLSEWQQHKAQLRQYIATRLDDTDIIDDILQEVYIKASQSLQQLKVRGSMKSWLYRITHNLIMDHYRTRKNFDELNDNLVAEPLSPIEESHQSLAKCIIPLIQELPEQYQLPLKMAELENKSQQEIANRLGISLSGAKSRVQRGRKKLREIMLSHCDLEITKAGVADFSPKTSLGKKYYKTICKP